MKVIICPDSRRVGEVAAITAAKLAKPIGPKVVFGVATGSSPAETFAEVARLSKEGEIDLSEASAFALDEYVGIAQGHPESYHEIIRLTVTEPWGLDPARVHVPNGFAEDLEAAGQEYEAAIKAAGGVDIQFLGIGSNGHIGFNEPGSSFASRTRQQALTQATRQDNARFFDSIDEVPSSCMTQGLGTIMDSRNAILVAFGDNKADAVAAMVEGPISAMCPGSILQMHPNAIIVVDEVAAAKLTLSDYFKQVYPHADVAL